MSVQVVDITRLLADLGVSATHDVLGCPTIAPLIPRRQRCGIYVLHFSNGEFYVGQSVEVARRFIDHRKNHVDIARISFREVAAEQLDTEEERTIKAFERERLHLRNIDIVTWTYSKTPFDELMPVADQNRWLEDLGWVDDAGDRITDLSLRHRTANKLVMLRRHPFGERAISVARQYVRLAVPAIRRGEQRFWTITVLPGPPHVLCRLNLNEQEVMTLSSDGDVLALSLHMARLPLVQRLRLTGTGWLRRGTSIEFTDHRYKPAGEDQVNLVAYGDRSIDTVLGDRAVGTAVRRMNLRLSRRGASLNAKSHCIDLATEILARG